MAALLGPTVKYNMDTLVMELTNESKFYAELSVLLRDKGRARKDWPTKKSVSDLVRHTVYASKTLTAPKRLTPNMMTYVYKQLMMYYQEQMNEYDEVNHPLQGKITGKGANFLIMDEVDPPIVEVDVSKAEAIVLGMAGVVREEFIHGKRHMGAFYSGPEGRDVYSAVAKETGLDRNQVKAAMFAHAYGSKSEQSIKFNNNGEVQMSAIKPFETIHLVNGRNSNDMSDNDIFEAITSIEDKIKTLEKMSAKSVAKDNAIQAHRDSIDELVKLVDARVKESK